MTDEQATERLKERLTEWQEYVAQPRPSATVSASEERFTAAPKPGPAPTESRRPTATAPAVEEMLFTHAVVRDAVPPMNTGSAKAAANRLAGVSAMLGDRQKTSSRRGGSVSPALIVMGALGVAVGCAVAVTVLLQ